MYDDILNVPTGFMCWIIIYLFIAGYVGSKMLALLNEEKELIVRAATLGGFLCSGWERATTPLMGEQLRLQHTIFTTRLAGWCSFRCGLAN